MRSVKKNEKHKTVMAHLDKELHKKLEDIVSRNSVSELYQFHATYPQITLFKTILENCICGCIEKCSVFNHFNINTTTRDFIDALFDLQYIVDPIVLCDIFNNIKSYDSWSNVNYFVSKFDAEALRSCYKIMDKDTSCEYIIDPLSIFYTISHTFYWGKLHPGARECYERLISAGCTSRCAGLEETQKYFTDEAYHIKWQCENNTENFLNFKQSNEYAEWLKF